MYHYLFVYISIHNLAGNSTALTITPVAGGASSVSAHLLIMRLSYIIILYKQLFSNYFINLLIYYVTQKKYIY